jgi:hypothetical protein
MAKCDPWIEGKRRAWGVPVKKFCFVTTKANSPRNKFLGALINEVLMLPTYAGTNSPLEA